jgi:hypothetical protein
MASAASPTRRSWPWPTARSRSSSPPTPTSANSSPTHPFLAPSVILLRRADKRAESLAAVILANLGQIADDLAAGTLIVISGTRIRARRLPG